MIVGSEISVTEMVTEMLLETEIIDPTLTEMETMVTEISLIMGGGKWAKMCLLP